MKTDLYVHPTGGNCEALMLELPDGYYAWFTDISGLHVPDLSQSDFIFCVYDAQGEELENTFLLSRDFRLAVEHACDTWGREYPSNIDTWGSE